MNAPALKLQQTPLRQVDSVKGLLMNQQARDQLAAVAARHMNPERMMRVVANAIRTTPALAACEPMSFLGALMQCASLGLEPNTILGHAYMIPFKNNRKGITEVQVVVGYKGLIDLARRSGHITSLSANIHYDDDELWEYEEGTEARLRHRPGMQKGKRLHAYAIAKFTDGGHAYVVLPWQKVEEIRDNSQGYQTAKRFGKTADSPWTKHLDEMAKKTAIRALAKYLPLSVEFVDAMSVDDAKADYRAFAMDPAQGLTIDENGEVLDGTAEEASEAEQISDQRATQQTVEPERPKEAAKRPAKRDSTPYAETPAKDAKQPAEAAQSAEEAQGSLLDSSPYQAILDRVTSDLLDGAKPEDLIAQFSEQIAAMKKDAPGFYETLREEILSYAPDLGGQL